MKATAGSSVGQRSAVQVDTATAAGDVVDKTGAAGTAISAGAGVTTGAATEAMTGARVSTAAGDNIAAGTAAPNRPTTWPAKALVSPLLAAEMTPAAWESMAEFVAILVKSPKRSSVLMELTELASGVLDNISLIVCASFTRSLFEIRMLLLVMRILLSFASTLLLTIPTAM